MINERQAHKSNKVIYLPRNKHDRKARTMPRISSDEISELLLFVSSVPEFVMTRYEPVDDTKIVGTMAQGIDLSPVQYASIDTNIGVDRFTI